MSTTNCIEGNRYGDVVERVGSDWLGPLHQHEGAEQYTSKKVIPRKIFIGANWLLEKISTGDSVLDVGCYGGYLYDWLIERSANRFIYTGVDVHIHEGVEAHRSSDARFVKSDILRYTERSDYVFCARVLLHQPDPIKVLRHIVGLTNKACIVVTPVWKEQIIRRATYDYEGTVYRTTLAKADLETQFDIEWIYTVDNPNKYSTFVICQT